VPNVLAIFNLPAILIGTAISGNVHQASEVVTAIASAMQWFVLGYLREHCSASLRQSSELLGGASPNARNRHGSRVRAYREAPNRSQHGCPRTPTSL
jgi:hypothetical protein